VLERVDLLLLRAQLYLSDREKEFLQSIRSHFIRKGLLSTGQESWLSTLEEKYSEESIQNQKLWDQRWSSDHREVALRVAKYYEANPPYFSKTVSKVLNSPETFLLSESEWNKFCGNKYAKRIISEYSEDPKFTEGECVQIRKRNKVVTANYNSGMPTLSLADKTGFVLKVNARPIIRAAKGSKIYQVLLAGFSVPIYAHESDLKKRRNTK